MSRQEPGRFSTQPEHIHQQKKSGVERGAVWLLSRARLDRPAHRPLGGSHAAGPGHRGRAGLAGLLNLADRHDAAAIEQACDVAFSHGAYRLRTIRQLLKREAPAQETFEFLEEHPIIRSLSDYGKLVATSFAHPWGRDQRPQVSPKPPPPSLFSVFLSINPGVVTMNESLSSALRKLRLSGLAQTLEVRLQEAAGHNLNHAEFLELILQDELAVRQERLIARRVKAAGFRELKTLDDFDWGFNPSIKKKQIFDLATLPLRPRAPRRALVGPPGVGKSPTWSRPSATRRSSRLRGAVPLDLRRGPRLPARRGLRRGGARSWPGISSPTCLIIDDMGMKQLPKRSGEYLFEIIMRRYETRSTMMTSNRPLEDWGKLIGDVPVGHGDPRPLPAPRRDHHDHRQELPAPQPGPSRRKSPAATARHPRKGKRSRRESAEPPTTE